MPVAMRLVTTATIDNPDLGDLYVDPETGSYVIIGDTPATFAEAVAQTIRQRLQFFRGEWFLDLREGTPYFEQILVKSPDVGVIRSIFSQVIAGTEGVAGVHDIEVDFDRINRTANVAFVADLADGSTLVSADQPPFVVRF